MSSTKPRVLVGAAATLLVVSILAVVGVLSPWLSLGPLGRAGVEGDGALVLITILTPLIAAIIGLTSKNISRWLGLGVFFSALLGVVICGVTLRNVFDLIYDKGLDVSIVGFGLWLTVGSTAIATGIGLGVALDGRRVQPPAKDPPPQDDLFSDKLATLQQRRAEGLTEPEFHRLVVVEAVMTEGPLALQIRKLKSLKDDGLLSDDEFADRLTTLIQPAST